MDPTPSQTVGPYLALGLPWADGPIADPDGVRVTGRVLDGAGDPIPDAMVETWQADPPAYARSLTDDEGSYQLTVPRTPYAWAHVFARGLLRHLTTRIHLDGDTVPHEVPADRRATLIAEPTDDGYRFDIRIQGDNETVFFDV